MKLSGEDSFENDEIAINTDRLNQQEEFDDDDYRTEETQGPEEITQSFANQMSISSKKSEMPSNMTNTSIILRDEDSPNINNDEELKPNY